MSDHETIEATIRQTTPSIEVCDGAVCQQWTTGDEAYEAWVAQTVAQHLAAAQAIAEAEARRELAAEVEAYLAKLDGNEQMLLAGIAILRGERETPPPQTAEEFRTYLAYLAEMTLDHNRGLHRLIDYLVQRGVIAL